MAKTGGGREECAHDSHLTRAVDARHAARSYEAGLEPCVNAISTLATRPRLCAENAVPLPGPGERTSPSETSAPRELGPACVITPAPPASIRGVERRGGGAPSDKACFL